MGATGVWRRWQGPQGEVEQSSQAGRATTTSCRRRVEGGFGWRALGEEGEVVEVVGVEGMEAGAAEAVAGKEAAEAGEAEEEEAGRTAAGQAQERRAREAPSPAHVCSA